MSDSFETVVKNFSGLSSEIKPTIAAGNSIPNGSRWRELTEGKPTKIFIFNKADDSWYPIEEYAALISGHTQVIDSRALNISEQILTVLKKIEYHLSVGSGDELKDQDV